MSTDAILGVFFLSIVIFPLSCLTEGLTDNFDFSWWRVLRNFALAWGALLVIGAGISGCYNSAWWQEKKAAEQQAEGKADTAPRLVATIGGCETYAFYSAGRWHYFTKCPKETTTEGTYTERHGKTTSTKSETITTENP